ncbi:MAG: hypothetical protein ABFS86_10305 [Planctomycetota bacterium]
MSDTEIERRFRAWINPLQFVSSVKPMPGTEAELPPVESVLKFMGPPDAPVSVEKAVGRYREISREKVRLFAAPAEDRILQKLVWPLRHAKCSYMFGHWMGAIAACGFVAEIAAIMLYDIWFTKRVEQGVKLSGKEAPSIPEFERMGQAERISTLREWDIIDDGVEMCFDLVHTKVTRYRQLWIHDGDTMPADTVEAYNAAVVVVVHAIGQETEEGRVILSEDLVAYLARSGMEPDSGA